MTLLEWLEDFIKQIENPEEPNSENGEALFHYRCGSYLTQKVIVEKLKYAIQQEKERLLNENRS